MPLTRIKLERFTAFRSLDLALSPGINVFIGANGTGKTHLLKAAYAIASFGEHLHGALHEKLLRCFLPGVQDTGSLLNRSERPEDGWRIAVTSDTGETAISAKKRAGASWGTGSSRASSSRNGRLLSPEVKSTYIPATNFLSNAPGFRSLYNTHEIAFEEVHADILDWAFRPALRTPLADWKRDTLGLLESKMGGEPTVRGEKFFLKYDNGEIDFSLVAEGFRKFALLWILVNNGTLDENSLLFWDEPEANLNPSLVGVAIEVMLALEKRGAQVLLATHDYVLLKEIELRRKDTNDIQFHSLYGDKKNGDIRCSSTREFLSIDPNAIAETYDSLYDRDVARALSKARNE